MLTLFHIDAFPDGCCIHVPMASRPTHIGGRE